MSHLFELTKKDNFPLVLCHVDCWEANFLVIEGNNNKELQLIDWEFSGNSDVGVDVGTFICCSDYTYEQGVDVIKRYYKGKPSKIELRHMIAYTSLISYCWFLLNVYYHSKRGVEDPFYEKRFYDNADIFHEGALPYYQD